MAALLAAVWWEEASSVAAWLAAVLSEEAWWVVVSLAVAWLVEVLSHRKSRAQLPSPGRSHAMCCWPHW